MITRHQCAICQRATARPQLCTDCQSRVNNDKRWQSFITGLFEVVAIITFLFLGIALAIILK
jgi:hypothetical protein